jgi:hypothetical protein
LRGNGSGRLTGIDHVGQATLGTQLHRRGMVYRARAQPSALRVHPGGLGEVHHVQRIRDGGHLRQ